MKYSTVLFTAATLVAAETTSCEIEPSVDVSVEASVNVPTSLCLPDCILSSIEIPNPTAVPENLPLPLGGLKTVTEYSTVCNEEGCTKTSMIATQTPQVPVVPYDEQVSSSAGVKTVTEYSTVCDAQGCTMTSAVMTQTAPAPVPAAPTQPAPVPANNPPSSPEGSSPAGGEAPPQPTEPTGGDSPVESAPEQAPAPSPTGEVSQIMQGSASQMVASIGLVVFAGVALLI